MKKSILIGMSILCFYSVQANDLAPVPGFDPDPDRTWFYNVEEVVFNSTSYVANGYVSWSSWYIDGVYQTGGAATTSFSACFALYGSPSGDCYELSNGQTTVQVKIRVQSNHGYWEEETITYTIQEHKGRKYFVKDHLGNVRTTVNRDGNVLGHDDYYPFGLSMPGRSSNSANPNDNYKFTSHELDDEAGLTIYHMNARGMDPITGRMMQIDNRHGKYPDISPYAYVANNPLAYTDMTGDTLDIQGSKEFIAQVYQAITYLEKAGVGGALEYLQNHSETISIIEGQSLTDFSYNDKNNTITFNPYSALEVQDNQGNLTGGVQTPALGLLHEAGHALNDLNGSIQSNLGQGVGPASLDPYHNLEERTVIMGIETAAATVLGEPTRTNHLGVERRTTCSTCTQKASPPTILDKIKGWFK